jgi:hypothetical protein
VLRPPPAAQLRSAVRRPYREAFTRAASLPRARNGTRPPGRPALRRQCIASDVCSPRGDATIIAALSLTKNAGKARDPEMHQTKKGNQWHIGMKAMWAWMPDRASCIR